MVAPMGLIVASIVIISASLTPAMFVRDASSDTRRLPITKRFNFTGSTSIPEGDRARVRRFRARGAVGYSSQSLSADASSIPAENQAITYVVSVGIGTPPTAYDLIVDTGSSNTWVGAGRAFVRTSSTRQTPDNVEVVYSSGSMFGPEFTDTVTLASDLEIADQSIGVAATSEGFDGVDGIIGLGPVDLTLGTLSPDSSATIPTITDNLFSQGAISERLVAISFEPTDLLTNVNGELTFGDTDPSKFIGTINFMPIINVDPSSEFFGIEACMRYGAFTILFANAVGIVDTGTTLLLIPTDSFGIYIQATGAVFDDITGLYRLTLDQFANLQSVWFAINGVAYEFIADAQIWPRALNEAIGGSPDFVYLIVGDIGTPAGSGLDFILGLTFLERFYAVFDTGSQRVGIANTPFTTAETNY